MDADTQEAESYKYSSKTVHVLPLESGKFAVFIAGRKLWSICGETALEIAITNASEASEREQKLYYESPAIQVEDVLNEVKVDLGDIEL